MRNKEHQSYRWKKTMFALLLFQDPKVSGLPVINMKKLVGTKLPELEIVLQQHCLHHPIIYNLTFFYNNLLITKILHMEDHSMSPNVPILGLIQKSIKNLPFF